MMIDTEIHYILHLPRGLVSDIEDIELDKETLSGNIPEFNTSEQIHRFLVFAIERYTDAKFYTLWTSFGASDVNWAKEGLGIYLEDMDRKLSRVIRDTFGPYFSVEVIDPFSFVLKEERTHDISATEYYQHNIRSKSISIPLKRASKCSKLWTVARPRSTDPFTLY